MQAAERTGLRQELFLKNGFVGQPVRQDVSGDISLDFLEDDERLPREHFSVRWRGYWYVPNGGPIAVPGVGDDWLNVHIDGELVLRRYPPEQMHRATGTATLAAGVHELLIEYEQEAAASALDVRWSPPSDRTRPFAWYHLFHERRSMEDVRLAERAAWLGWAVTLLWVAPLVTVAGVGARRAWQARDRYGRHPAFYRPWPVTTHQTETNAQGVAVTGERDRTFYLPRSGCDGNLPAQFLHQFRSSDRVWYLGHRLRSERVVEAMTNAGYTVQVAEASTDYRLFRGTR